jgi:hypothetical protein
MLKDKLIKNSAKVVGHARYVAFQMDKVAISRNLFADILRPKIAAAAGGVDPFKGIARHGFEPINGRGAPG